MYYAIKFIMFEHLSKTYLLILFKSCKKLQTCSKLGTLGLIFKYMYKPKNRKNFSTKMLGTLDDTQYI